MPDHDFVNLLRFRRLVGAFRGLLVAATAVPFVLVLGLGYLAGAPCRACAADGAGAARVDHVLIVGIDGMTLRATGAGITPNIAALAARGAVATDASAVPPTWSAPNWATLLMGAGPTDHGIDGNGWRPRDWRGARHCGRPEGAGWPTLFHLLKEQRPGLRSAVFHHWVGILRFIPAGVADTRLFTFTAGRTVRLAARHLRRERPALAFVQLDQVDAAGHDYGYDSPEYMQAVAQADSQLGTLLQALRDGGIAERTLVLAMSDHGGVDAHHLAEVPEVRQIAWVLSGPGVPPGTVLDDPVSIADTAPTLAWALGLERPTCWTGRPVTEAFGVATPDGTLGAGR